MAIKIDIITPISAVVEVPGNSQIIEVMRSTQTPLTTDSTRAVIDIVGPRVITGIIAQQAEPADPQEGMVWLSW